MTAQKVKSSRAARREREALVQIWVGKETIADIKQAAASNELTLSGFIRQAAIEAARQVNAQSVSAS